MANCLTMSVRIVFLPARRPCVHRKNTFRAAACVSAVARLEAAQLSDAFDDFFGGGVGGGVGCPAAVACEGEDLGAAGVKNFCYRGAGGGWAVGSHDRAGDAVGYAVVESGFDQDELDVVRCGALVEFGEEQLAFHGRGLNFYFQRELAYGERGDTAAEE